MVALVLARARLRRAHAELIAEALALAFAGRPVPVSALES